MSSSRDGESIIDLASSYIRREGGLGKMITNVGFGGVIMALILGITETIEAFFRVLIEPVLALAFGTADIVDTALGAPSTVIEESLAPVAIAFTEGASAALGPFAPLLGVAIGAAIVWLFLEFLKRIPVSPLAFLRDD